MQNPIVQQVVETLRGANNVLITVKNSPSVDELTGAIALTLILNHMNKHATTVFSGQVPSTIEFLQPEMAIETNTDSLRDFIIALDKSKADKLRYKVEDNVVRIFITPYRSSISEDDLEFSQGDFNVDVVVALGVLNKDDFDQAITSHGRILHDATVIAVSKDEIPNEVGAISWQDAQASSISEMIATISDLFGADVVDSQIATALMTGIVAETDRFKNDKTSPAVLSVSSMLLSAGANQQLIAEKLEHAELDNGMQPLQPLSSTENSNGLLDVAHAESNDGLQQINIDEDGNIAAPSISLQNGSSSDGSAALAIPQDEYGTDGNLEKVDLPEDILRDADSPQRPIVTGRSLLTQAPMNSNGEDDAAHDEPTGGLFGESMHSAENSHEDAAHKSKVLQPLGSVDNVAPVAPAIPPVSDGSTPPTSPPPASPPASKARYEPPASSTPTGLGITKPADEPSSTDDNDTQTLRDIEVAVHSPHVSSKESGTVDDYLGSVKKPEANNMPDELPALPESPLSSSQPKPEPPAEPKAKIVAPQPVAPSAAPAVPPPLMPLPQASSSQPQFYESDGSKSNPLVH